MTFEEFNRAMEFIVEQQARISASLDSFKEQYSLDREWSKGMIKQLAASNQTMVELIASNMRRIEDNEKEYRRFASVQEESLREQRDFQKESQKRHEETLGHLQRILDRLVRNN